MNCNNLPFTIINAQLERGSGVIMDVEWEALRVDSPDDITADDGAFSVDMDHVVLRVDSPDDEPENG